jgi:translocation and assembly module TamB
VKKFFGHPLTQKTRRILRRVVVTSAVILAVVFVTTVSVDLGPALRERAERAGTNYLKRGMHIGGLSVRLWNGKYIVRDFVIDGMTPTSRPFLTAKTIEVSMLWSTLLDRRVVFDSVVMDDWKMFVETKDGVTSFPNFRRGGSTGPRPVTVTMQYVIARRGEFIYDDRDTPWSVSARNLEVTVAKPSEQYVGSARFHDGLVAIQKYVPFRADMDTTFKIDEGRVVFDAINLATDGTKSVLKGDVNLSHWPEQMYSITSTIDLPRMRQLFFANDKFELAGTMRFDGFFHLFKDVRPDGTTRTGRELKGNFQTNVAHVNEYRFDDLRGYVRWIPEALEVHDATAQLFGGSAQFEYAMAPLGRRGVPATNRFDATVADVDLTEFSDFMELQGVRLAGRASGRNLLTWPSGSWRERRGEGELAFTPPDGAPLMTRQMPLDQIRARIERGDELGPFSNHTPREPVPIGGTLTYRFEPDYIDIAPSRLATPTTYVEVEGRTFNGERSQIPFHVSSADWQESDRLFAGMLTAFGSPTNAIPIGGYGTFDGVMYNAFRRPRIEGTFTGEQMRAFDVVWGSVRGEAVIENSYADVKNVLITSGESTISTSGRFSLGYPRRDGGEQINADIRIIRRPVADLKHAFGLDDYDLDGTFSGQFKVSGEYQRPFGGGTMAITEGVAYGESFNTANARVTLEGNGVRLSDIQMVKLNGRGTGSAFVGWNGTYSFNFDANNIALETLDSMAGSTLPLSGLIDFRANGSGSFDRPRYEVTGTIRDVFVADEGIGQVFGDLSIDGEQLLIQRLEASSARLVVSGSGQITLNEAMDAEITLNVTDTSLDPYVRAFNPRLSPYTTAVASGTIRVYGELADIDRVIVDATVDRFDARLFDYAIRNPDDPDPARAGRRLPIRIALDRHTVRVTDMRLVGQDTELDVTGAVNLHDETIVMRAIGRANLGILQGFMPSVSSRGRAELSATLAGAMRDPTVSGTMNIIDGRIRYFGVPGSPGLDAISGVVRFDTRSVNLDQLSATLGGGPVQFGGTIGVEGYQLGRVDMTMSGQGMRVRLPQDMTSRVDADLALRGTIQRLTLSGDVTVRDAVYRGVFEAGGSVLSFGGADAALPVSPVTGTAVPLNYDVQITAPSTLRVDNRLLRNVVASADLRLSGTYDRPLLFGDVTIEDGVLLFEGRRYEVQNGTVTFNNPTRIEPYFDLETETRVRTRGETYRITVRAVGVDPISGLSFRSDPELPEYQLLALLLSDIAPGQDVEFRPYEQTSPQAQLVRDRIGRGLTGVVSEEVQQVVETALGLDTFQLNATLQDPNQQSNRVDPGARVTMGKWLTERIFLTYTRSLSSSTRDQVIVLEIDQSDQLSWILSRNEDGTYAVEMRVRRTF